MAVEPFHLCRCCRHRSELHRWRWADATQLGFGFWNTGNGKKCVKYTCCDRW